MAGAADPPGSRPPAERAPRGRTIPALGGVAISVVAVAGCVVWALGQPAPQFPTGGGALLALAAALGVLGVSMLLRGFRWAVILDRAGIDVAPVEPYALILVGYMGNAVLPLRGGEVLRVVLLKDRSDASWPNAIGSIVPERVLDVITLALLLVAVVLGGVVEVPGGAGPPLAVIAALVAAAAAGAAYMWMRRRGRLGGLADRIRPFAHASRLLLTPAGPWLLLLSLGVWLLDGAICLLVADSLSLSIGLLEAIGLAVAAAAFSAIPAGPAFAGTYDAALLFGLTALDVPPGQALSFVLLLRSVTFLPITIAGLAVLVGRYGGLGRLRRSAQPEGGPI
jgi:uncharacterized membrane protein YbhN (UPF0104 family)